MNNLGDVHVDELRNRMEIILGRLDSLFKQVGPLVQEIGDLRAECALIYKEFSRRGIISNKDPRVNGD